MYRYDMFAIPQGTLRPDLALARKQRCEMNAAELNRAAAVPDPYLISALQDDIRKRKLELASELMEYEFHLESCTPGTRQFKLVCTGTTCSLLPKAPCGQTSHQRSSNCVR